MTKKIMALSALATVAFMTGAAHASGGLQLATEWDWARDGGRIFNATVVLGGFFYLVYKFGYPVLKKRADDIRSEIRELDEAKEMAQKSLADYQKKLEAIKGEHDKALSEAKEDAEAIRKKILEQADEAANRILDRAADQINMETEQARARLKKETTLLAIEAAEELLRKNITTGDHKALLGEYISRMERNN